MRYGLIDVGSNTIRLIVFETDGKNIKIILKEKELSVILNFIKNGELLDIGKERLLKVLYRFKQICDLLGCIDIYCFATASIRKINNSDFILYEMKKIIPNSEIITGKQEAYYDYVSLIRCIKDKNGIGLDLGGGSMQIFKFKDKQLVDSASMPIGGLELKNKFVSMTYPTYEEIENIERFVKYKIEESKILKKNNNKTIYLMGGSARAVAKIHKYIYNTNKKIHKYFININELNKLKEKFSSPKRCDIDIIEKIVPERMNNIIPSLIILNTVCNLSGAKEAIIIKSSIREGYIKSKILNK